MTTKGRAPLAPRAEVARLEEALDAPSRTQEQTLAAIVGSHRDTEIGRAQGLSSVRGLADLKALPFTTYADYQPWVARVMAENPPDLLFPGRASFVAKTSGTTGESKYFAYAPLADERERFRVRLSQAFGAIERRVPGVTQGFVGVLGKLVEGATESGVRIGSASGFVQDLAGPEFECVPMAVWNIDDADDRYYCILRFGLARDLRLLGALNPSTLLTLFGKGLEFAAELAVDLASGGLHLPSGAPAPAELALAAPDFASSAAAARLRSTAASGHFDPRTVWPNLAVFHTWKGGMCAHYVRVLEERCPEVIVWPQLINSTEAVIGIPLEASWSGAVPALLGVVLEFFPEDSEPHSDAVVPLEELEEGAFYRVAVSNFRGMTRYLLDDVFQIEGRHRHAPIIRFSHRHGFTSSLTGEKLTEVQVIEALQAAAGDTVTRILDYQLRPRWGEPPGYVLFVEYDGAPPADFAATLAAFERELQRRNEEYASKRTSGRLTTCVGIAAPRGTFGAVRNRLARRRQGNDAQVKVAKLSRELLGDSLAEGDPLADLARRELGL